MTDLTDEMVCHRLADVRPDLPVGFIVMGLHHEAVHLRDLAAPMACGVLHHAVVLVHHIVVDLGLGLTVCEVLPLRAVVLVHRIVVDLVLVPALAVARLDDSMGLRPVVARALQCAMVFVLHVVILLLRVVARLVEGIGVLHRVVARRFETTLVTVDNLRTFVMAGRLEMVVRLSAMILAGRPVMEDIIHTSVIMDRLSGMIDVILDRQTVLVDSEADVADLEVGEEAIFKVVEDEGRHQATFMVIEVGLTIVDVGGDMEAHLEVVGMVEAHRVVADMEVPEVGAVVDVVDADDLITTMEVAGGRVISIVSWSVFVNVCCFICDIERLLKWLVSWWCDIY